MNKIPSNGRQFKVMSSLTSRWSHVPARERYFTVLDASSSLWYIATTPVPPITALTPTMSSFDFVQYTSPPTAAGVGVFLRDLGRSITVYDASNNGTQLAIFRQVQELTGTGIGTEGVGSIGPHPFICVWSANDTNDLTQLNGFTTATGARRAMVARTG